MQHGRIWLTAGSILVTASFIAVGCHHRGQPPATSRSVGLTPSASTVARPASTPSTLSSGGNFTRKGIHLDYPPGWTQVPDKDFELVLKPADPALAGCVITLDIPDLPFHVPGMIPMGMVTGGYLDDLKKHAAVDVRTREEAVEREGVKGKLLSSTWTSGGKASMDLALVLIHLDHVYILRGAGDETTESAMKKIHDQAAKSIRWME